MAFVNDLDFLSLVATVAAVAASAFVTILTLRDWRNGWDLEFEGAFPFAVMLGLLFLAGASNSYSPNEYAPRKTVEGVARFVGEHRGKSSYSKYICATSCQLTGGYALALDRRAARLARIGSIYDFTYLDEPMGGAGSSLKVIRVALPGSAEALYSLDLTNHPYRIAIYLFDLTLMLCTILLLFILDSKPRRKSSEEFRSDSDEESEPRGDSPITLHLETKEPR